MKSDFRKKYELLIMKDLYESINGLYSFTFYSKHKIEPNHLFEFIKKYTNKSFITYENDKLTLTPEGRKFAFSTIFHNKTEIGLTSNLPKYYYGEKIDKNIPYIPIIDYFRKTKK